jgi:1,2-dihydroxy-3-keto-5-methylthiopentene dioxygenase
MTITAWLMDTEESDQRLQHRAAGESDVSLDMIAKLGVLHWSGINGVDDPRLAEIKAERGYTYTDVISVHPDTLPDFENKIKNFFREHIHYDEEIRFCVEGSGYFDVRGPSDEWIRITLEAGDMIVLPEGIYHRFTCDDKDYIKAMRLFVGAPIWTPYNRDEIDQLKDASRLKYVASFLSA